MNKIAGHFNKIADSYDSGKKKYEYYYLSLKNLLASLIGKNKNVFEIGCGTGDLLVSLSPKAGYGQDISSIMIRIAKNKYKNMKAVTFSTLWPKEKYDYIFMSDVIEHLENPLYEFNNVYKHMNGRSKFIITMANPLWEPMLMLWERLGLKMKEGPHKRIGYKDIGILSEKVKMRVTKHDYKLLIPIQIPFVTKLLNKYIEPVLKPLSFIEYFVLEKV